jgi:hypothetical protein
MELDKALRLALIQSWEDILKVHNSCSVRIEYQQEAGAPLDYLSVWSDRPKGYQFLICNYWKTTTSAHARGARFANEYCSDQLAQNLDFIMENQDQFPRPADASRSGLVLIDPPSDKDRAEASSWMSGVQEKHLASSAAELDATLAS